MKKAVSVVTAAVLAASVFGTMTVEATQNPVYEYTKEHQPYSYFKADEGDGHILLRDDFIYVNRSRIPKDGEIVNADLYVYDKFKGIRDIIICWYEKTGSILLRNGYSAVDKHGGSSFVQYDMPGKSTAEHMINIDNGMGIMLADPGLAAYTLTGENTDDYPVACFDMVIPKDIECQVYNVDYVSPEFKVIGEEKVQLTSDHASVSRVYEDDRHVNYGLVGKCPNLQINVSDRDLGDFDQNRMVDTRDAEGFLRLYTDSMNNSTPRGEYLTAGDVNADREFNDDDVDLILEYSLLCETTGLDMTFTEFAISKIAEE